VDAVSPASAKLSAVVVVPICVKDVQLAPAQRSTRYPTTATLSVDAVQVSPICVAEEATAVRPDGAVGAVVSGAELMATVADADFVGSACEMAETVTVAGFGTAEGAV
jgi:hypothetical protein